MSRLYMLNRVYCATSVFSGATEMQVWLVGLNFNAHTRMFQGKDIFQNQLFDRITRQTLQTLNTNSPS
jgi:hypothetical protein